MAVKNISTRAQICGRGAGCHGGHSAIKQSGYISREEMYSEYDGLTYYPKYSDRKQRPGGLLAKAKAKT